MPLHEIQHEKNSLHHPFMHLQVGGLFWLKCVQSKKDQINILYNAYYYFIMA